MTAQSLVPQSTALPTTSVREQSVSTIQAAILSPHNAGNCLKRTNAILGLFFDPDFDPETKAQVREEFVRALASYPDWAVNRAFDAWAKTMGRRPSPAEIVTLVGREMKPLTDELKRRGDAIEQQAALSAPPRVSAEQSDSLMQSAGFTIARVAAMRRSPMAGSLDEAEKHVNETAAAFSNHAMSEAGAAQLAASRASSPIYQAAMAGVANSATGEATA